MQGAERVNFQYPALYSLKHLKSRHRGVIKNTWGALTAQTWSFPLQISSVNATKSVVFCRFDHIYWKNPSWKTSFFCSDWFLSILDTKWLTNFVVLLIRTRKNISTSSSFYQSLSKIYQELDLSLKKQK